MKLLIGGSPCTHWSIAQTKNRETEASGIGWELFLNYRIARDKYKPDFFLYENNKSMSPAIRAQITAELGVEPVLINSALVSAQNRQRLYWVGKRNPDGTYSQVRVEQPEDRGVCLLDVLTADDLAPYNGGEFKKLKADLHAKFASTWQVGKTGNGGGQAVRVYDILGKSVTLKALERRGFTRLEMPSLPSMQKGVKNYRQYRRGIRHAFRRTSELHCWATDGPWM